MAIRGSFRIQIAGKKISEKKNLDLIDRVTGLVRKLDYDARFFETTFARLDYRFEWSGKPKNFGDANSLIKFLVEKVGEYMRNWIVDVEIKLIEEE